MAAPSLCGNFLTNRRSMVAFTWTVTTVMTLVAFLTAIVLVLQINTHYRRMEHYYQSEDFYQNYYANYEGHQRFLEEGGKDGGGGNKDGQNGNHGGGGDSGDHGKQNGNNGGGTNEKLQYAAVQQAQAHILLSSMSAPGITFVSLYTMFLAICLSLYGSTAIVGFMSLRGVYIAPCFSSDTDNLKIGIFGGAIVLFANLLIVCAVILGELRVDDYQYIDRDDKEPYQVERIAAVLAVTCMFLSALYTMFAILLFLCYASDEVNPGYDQEEEYNPAVVVSNKPLVSVSNASDRPRSQRGFSSQ